MKSRLAKKKTKQLLLPIIQQLQVIDPYCDFVFQPKTTSHPACFWLAHEDPQLSTTITEWALIDNQINYSFIMKNFVKKRI